MKVKSGDRAAVKWVLAKSRKQHPRLIMLVIGNALYAAMSVLFALMCRSIIDGATGGLKEKMLSGVLGLLLVIGGMLALRLFCNGLNERVRAELENDMRQDIFGALLKKDFSSTAAYHSGELLNRMFSDVNIVVDGAVGIFPPLVNMLTRLVGAAAVLLMLDRRFTLIFICAGTLLFAISLLLRRRIKHLHKDVQEKQGIVRSFLQESTENLLAVKSFGVQDKMLSRSRENQTLHFRARMKRRAVTILANAGFGFVFQMGYLYAIAWGGFRLLDGTMSFGTLTAILQLVNQIQQPFAELSSLMPRFYAMTASAERIMELQQLPNEPTAERTLSYEKLSEIKTENMDFSYKNNHVLKNVNISIKKGELVSLTGISGGGKSTLFLLLLGAYRPQGGSIGFLSESGESFSAGAETRPLLAYVPQGNILFSGTVRENIAFLNDSASEQEIISAAETACAMEFISALPDGMDTRIGENGFGISEGQAQRIAVARAILGGAPVMLLDEATSALDEDTEARLLQNIAALKDRTVLIVTHRRAALDICTKHLTLKNGEIFYERI